MAVKRKPCAKCGRNRALKFYAPRGRVCSFCQKRRTSNASRETRLLETYGISLADYDAMLAAQGGVCAICGGTRKANLDVDHSHKTYLVRGLLCRRCNRRLLPASLDQVDLLLKAIEYLNNPPAFAVLGERECPRRAA